MFGYGRAGPGPDPVVATISVYLVVYKDAPLDALLPPDEKDERPKVALAVAAEQTVGGHRGA